MSISLRLDPETESAIRRRLAANGASMSDFVRSAIKEKLEREVETTTPYALGESLFGRFASGDTDRSRRRKAAVRERIHAKHRR